MYVKTPPTKQNAVSGVFICFSFLMGRQLSNSRFFISLRSRHKSMLAKAAESILTPT